MRYIIAVVLLVFLSSLCVAQEPSPAKPEPQSKAEQGPASDKVNVYVYRERRFYGSGLEPSVYCDGAQVARMDNGRFFVMQIPPGKHVIRSSDKKHEVSLDFKTGQTYYIRIDLHTGTWRGNGRPIFVIPEQAQEELKKNLTYIGQDKVVDKNLVLANPPALAQ